MSPDAKDDLHWLAFRYIAGEMSEEETAAFEQRLGEDQESREAVAAVVELTEAAAVAASDLSPAGQPSVVRPAVPLPVHWSVRLAWSAVGAAACLVVVIIFNAAGGLPSGDDPAGRDDGTVAAEEAADPAAAEIAVLWTQTREELVTGEQEPWPADVPGALDEPYPAVADVDDLAAADVVPAWMQAAAAALTAEEEDGPVEDN